MERVLATNVGERHRKWERSEPSPRACVWMNKLVRTWINEREHMHLQAWVGPPWAPPQRCNVSGQGLWHLPTAWKSLPEPWGGEINAFPH
jgi:hypothetical protein